MEHSRKQKCCVPSVWNAEEWGKPKVGHEQGPDPQGSVTREPEEAAEGRQEGSGEGLVGQPGSGQSS